MSTAPPAFAERRSWAWALLTFHCLINNINIETVWWGAKVTKLATTFIFLTLVYVYITICLRKICTIVDEDPGPVIFIPFVQFVPLLAAAKVSQWYLPVLFVPILNRVAFFIIMSKICAKLRRSGWLAVPALLPITNLFLLGHLAFSNPTSQV